MATATETPAARPAQTSAAANVLRSHLAAGAPGQRPVTPAKPEDTAPEFDPALFDIWLRQATLILMVAAAVVGLAAARMAERSWIGAVFCSCAAVTVTGVLGLAISGLMAGLVQSTPEKKL